MNPSKLITAVLCLAVSGTVAAQPTPWRASGAGVLPAGQWQIGVFQPVRLGIGHRMELSTHVSSLFDPQLEVARELGTRRGWSIATRHGVNVPTPLLKTVAREGIGGFLPGDTRVPWIVGIRHSVVATRNVAPERWVSVGAAFRWAIGADPDLPSIDLPVIYHRMAPLQGDPVLEAWSALETATFGSGRLILEAGLLHITSRRETAFEHSAIHVFHSSARFGWFLGYRWVAAAYPFGSQRHWLPRFGVRWAGGDRVE